MRSPGWGWGLRAADGVRRRREAAWVGPLVTAAPWLTLGTLVLMLHLVGGTLTAERGVVFDLPDAGLGESAPASLVALVLPTPRETLVFFDDARYVLGDPQSVAAFREQLAERAAKRQERTLLVLADRRASAGDLMRLAAAARRGGVERILFAEKRPAQAEGAE